MPLVALALHRLVARPTWRGALALGAAGAFQAATSIYYGVIGAVGAAVSLVSLIVATGGRRTATVAGCASPSRRSIGAVLVAPFVWPYLQVQRREGFARNLFEAARHAATPASYVSAPEANAVYGRTGLLRTDRGAEHELFPGLVVTALAIYGLVVARRRGSGPLAAAATATLRHGLRAVARPRRRPRALRHAARLRVRLPGRSAPRRASPCSSRFGLATLAAIATREITDGPRGRWIGLGLLALLAVEYLPGPARVDAGPADDVARVGVAGASSTGRAPSSTCR